MGHYECEVFEELDDYIKLDKLKELEEIGIKGKKYYGKKYFEENYISKDKIREKIKELEQKDKNTALNMYNYGIFFLKELLNEQN